MQMLSGFIEGYLRIPLDIDSNKNLVNQDINEMIKEPSKRRL
jgi:hypothetical protein